MAEPLPPTGCIIHFGMDKTGSSAIQSSLRQRLADPRFHYASLTDAKHGNANVALLAAFMRDPGRSPRIRQLALGPAQLASLGERTRERLRAELACARERTVIVSSEALARLEAEELAALVALVREATGDVTAVGYIRSPRSYLASAFQQILRSGAVAPVTLGSVPLGYRRQFHKFQAVLGADNVRFWRFDRAAFPEGCVVQDFCARLGMRFPPGRVATANESLSLPAVQLLAALRAHDNEVQRGREAVQRNERLLACLSGLGGAEFRLHPALVAQLAARHRAEIAWMEEQLGCPLDEATADETPGAIRDERGITTCSDEARTWLSAHSPRAAAEAGAWTPQFVGACMAELRAGLALPEAAAAPGLAPGVGHGVMRK